MLPAPKVLEGAAPLPTARGRRRSLLLPPNTCFAPPKRPRNRKGKFPPSSLRSWLCSVGRRRLFQRHGGSDVWPVPTSQRAWSRVLVVSFPCLVQANLWTGKESVVVGFGSDLVQRQQRSECMSTSSARHTVRQLQQKQQQQHCQPQSNHLPLHHQPAQSSLSFHLEPQPRTRTMRGSCKQRET